MLEMIISSFIVGFLVAVPPGAVTVVAAQKSILYGFKDSMFFTIGSCLSDIFYILIVLFGIAPLFADGILFKIIFWYFSSILLFYFGFDAFRAFKKKIAFSNNPGGHKTLIKNIVSGILITLSNPMTIAGWLVIAGGFFTHWKASWPSIQHYGIFSIIFMMFGVLCWFIPLLFVISKVKYILNNTIIKGFVLLSGLFFISVGLFSFFSATNLIFNMIQ